MSVQFPAGTTPVVQNPVLLDAFGRLRTSQPFTLFDSKQIIDNQPLYYDDQEVSGSGTTTSYVKARASTTIGVSNLTAGKRVRQTFQRFNYQPGKSQLVMCTGVIDTQGGASGISSGMGITDGSDGIYTEVIDGTLYMTIASSVSGGVVYNRVAQSSWNGDRLDGTGGSGIVIDVSDAQIFWCDYEWLGVGRVRTGFVIGGEFIVCNTFFHANTIQSVYMKSPNLPVRYWIENDGTGPATTLEHICSTVMSEDGKQPNGCIHYHSTAGTHLDANTANTIYAALGLRLKSTSVGQVVDLLSASMINQQNDDYEWLLLWNPVVNGTFTYSDLASSSVQVATGDSTNTVTTSPYIMEGGMVKGGTNSGQISATLSNALRLGAAIDGTLDEIVLGVRPLSANSDIEASLTWQEVV